MPIKNSNSFSNLLILDKQRRRYPVVINRILVAVRTNNLVRHVTRLRRSNHKRNVEHEFRLVHSPRHLSLGHSMELAHSMDSANSSFESIPFYSASHDLSLVNSCNPTCSELHTENMRIYPVNIYRIDESPMEDLRERNTQGSSTNQSESHSASAFSSTSLTETTLHRTISSETSPNGALPSEEQNSDGRLKSNPTKKSNQLETLIHIINFGASISTNPMQAFSDSFTQVWCGYQGRRKLSSFFSHQEHRNRMDTRFGNLMQKLKKTMGSVANISQECVEDSTDTLESSSSSNNATIHNDLSTHTGAHRTRRITNRAMQLTQTDLLHLQQN